MANRVGEFMETEGVKFVRECVPTKIEKIEDPTEGEPGLYKVYGKYNNGDEFCDTFNTSKWAQCWRWFKRKKDMLSMSQ